MKRCSYRFGLSLNIILLSIVIGILSISISLLTTNLVSAISVQEKGGVVKPSPTPTPKPRSGSRLSTRTSTSSGTSRRTTAPTKPRQPAPSMSRRSVPNIEMVYIPSGTFMMGTPENEEERSYDELPQHRVTVQGFYMGKYELTQAQWQIVMGNNPSNFKGDDLPIEQVSWDDSQEFIRRLNAMQSRYKYRLPTEAEWEYAARAGTTMQFAFGVVLSTSEANFNDNSKVYRQMTMPVGSFLPNRFGLYDMHGNVWEWCEDYWHSNYDGAPTDGSAWLSGRDSSHRVLRGGSWNVNARNCRSAYRSKYEPDVRNYDIGFRLAAIARTQ